MTVKPKGSFRN